MKKKKDVFNSNLRKKTTLLGIKPGSKNKKYYLVAVDYALFQQDCPWGPKLPKPPCLVRQTRVSMSG